MRLGWAGLGQVGWMPETLPDSELRVFTPPIWAPELGTWSPPFSSFLITACYGQKGFPHKFPCGSPNSPV
jgi:hypothetical protein